MIEPTGYTALDLIGFTDKGGYDPTATYVKNDIVTVGNTKWRCKIDDTTGITPTEGANWTIYLESATSLAGMDDVTLTSPKNGDGLVHDGNDWTNIPIMTKEQWQKNGAYNICPNNATSQVVQGVTYTVKSDGTITASNTASANSVLGVCEGIKFKAGTYKVVGTPTGGNYNTGYSVYVQKKSDYSTVATDAPNSGGLTPIFVADGNTEYNVLIMVRSGATSPANDFKPMITTDLNATYDDYVPHAKTNRELTEDLFGVFKPTPFTPDIYDGNTKVGNFATNHCMYYKIGGVYIILIYGDLPSGGINCSTQLQIRNLPCPYSWGGSIYAFVGSTLQDVTLQPIDGGKVYPRPNITGNVTSISGMIIGSDYGYWDNL